MIVIRKFKLFIVQLIISISFLYSQDDELICDFTSFTIKEELFNEDIVAYYLSAIDVNSGTSYVSLFRYSIEGNQDCYELDFPSNINLILEFSMNIFSPSIGFN